MKNRSLKRQLFMTTVVVIAFAFLILYLTFNLAMGAYIEKTTRDSIVEEFKYIEGYYSEAAGQEGGIDHFEPSTGAPVNHLIMDQNGAVAAESLYYPNEKKSQAMEVVNYLRSHKDLIGDGKSDTFNINGRTYLYEAKLLDFAPANVTVGSEEGYYALVFLDISSMILLKKTLYLILGGAMVIVLVPAALIAFKNSRRIDKSFSQLKENIEALGKREDIKDQPLGYAEFDQMMATISSISKKLDEAERTRRIFFQNASHELRTPLMSIQGYAEGIQKEIGQDPKASAGVILDESRKMKALVDDILTLSRIESGAERLEIEAFDIRELLDSCISAIQRQAAEKGVDIACDFSRALMVEADENKLSHAIMNILTNAVRYANTYINIDHEESPDGIATITISNDGPMIPPSDLPHIFDRFFKGNDGQFGIGLSMAKEIVSLHGGQILVRSDEEETGFSILIPRRDLRLS